jgi:hypothetical protein
MRGEGFGRREKGKNNQQPGNKHQIKANKQISNFKRLDTSILKLEFVYGIPVILPAAGLLEFL